MKAEGNIIRFIMWRRVNFFYIHQLKLEGIEREDERLYIILRGNNLIYHGTS